ncbi:MAG: hypothetical protein GYA34_14665 [Chloroflexi bacterium]|nr:hypothetical protein [Chloroflexota bacterium]
MFARSSAGEQFNISYGDFLTNFMTHKEYGEDFNWSGNFSSPPKGKDWDRLCYEIIKHISSRNYRIMDKYRKIIGATIECKKVGFEIKYSFRSYLNWFIWKICLCRKINCKRKPVLVITLNTNEGL